VVHCCPETSRWRLVEQVSQGAKCKALCARDKTLYENLPLYLPIYYHPSTCYAPRLRTILSHSPSSIPAAEEIPPLSTHSTCVTSPARPLLFLLEPFVYSRPHLLINISHARSLQLYILATCRRRSTRHATIARA